MLRVIVIPFSEVFEKNALFKLESKFNHDSRCVPFNYLYQKLTNIGFEVNTYDLFEKYYKTDIFLFLNNRRDLYRNFSKYNNNNFILVAQEPLDKNNFQNNNFSKFAKIITWRSDLLKKNNNFIKNTAYPIVKVNIDWLPLKEKKILANISINKKSRIKGELYSERAKTIEIAEKIFGSQFELYGIGWDKPTRLIDKIINYKPPVSYKGSLKEKYPKLREFKFALCYENNRLLPGNVSEKIFDCFQCGVIPLYWGAPDILDFIAEETFIRRERFRTNEEMLLYIKNMSDEEIELKLEAIKTFLNSKSIEPFWYQNHIQVIIDTILNISQNIKAG